jgi:flagellar L-ring protein precursor FlgH
MLVTVLAALTMASAAAGESIWSKRDKTAAFLYRDSVAGDVGDTITVLVTDASSFKHKDARTMGKEADMSAAGAVQHTSRRTGATTDTLFNPYTLSEKSSRSFKGSNDYSGSRAFSDVITVTVIDRLPNGNLVVGGRSEREIAGETAATILTGIVRPLDIAGDNTISSTRVSQLKLYYETSGPSRSFLEQGFLSKIINFIWPF